MIRVRRQRRLNGVGARQGQHGKRAAEQKSDAHAS